MNAVRMSEVLCAGCLMAPQYDRKMDGKFLAFWAFDSLLKCLPKWSLKKVWSWLYCAVILAVVTLLMTENHGPLRSFMLLFVVMNFDSFSSNLPIARWGLRGVWTMAFCCCVILSWQQNDGGTVGLMMASRFCVLTENGNAKQGEWGLLLVCYVMFDAIVFWTEKIKCK